MYFSSKQLAIVINGLACPCPKMLHATYRRTKKMWQNQAIGQGGNEALLSFSRCNNIPGGMGPRSGFKLEETSQVLILQFHSQMADTGEQKHLCADKEVTTFLIVFKKNMKLQ